MKTNKELAAMIANDINGQASDAAAELCRRAGVDDVFDAARALGICIAYNVVGYDGGFRLLRRYSADSYIINGEDLTRVQFDTREQAEKVLDLLGRAGYADGYDGSMERVSLEERAIADHCDHAPVARLNCNVVPDDEPEDDWLDNLHLSTAVKRQEQDPDYDWLREVYGGDQGDASTKWDILHLCGMVEDYPADYQTPQR